MKMYFTTYVEYEVHRTFKSHEHFYKTEKLEDRDITSDMLLDIKNHIELALDTGELRLGHEISFSVEGTTDDYFGVNARLGCVLLNKQ